MCVLCTRSGDQLSLCQTVVSKDGSGRERPNHLAVSVLLNTFTRSATKQVSLGSWTSQHRVAEPRRWCPHGRRGIWAAPDSACHGALAPVCGYPGTPALRRSRGQEGNRQVQLEGDVGSACAEILPPSAFPELRPPCRVTRVCFMLFSNARKTARFYSFKLRT